MNRHERRAQAAQAASPRNADVLRRAIAVLANAGPTATGATIIYPDGTTAYLPRTTADAMQGRKGAGGRA